MKRVLIASTLLVTLAAPMAMAAPQGCPPGLAKKSPVCIPPGQAKKAEAQTHVTKGDQYRFSRGDHLRGDYVVIRDPARYGLDANGTFYRVRDNVYRVDQDTKEVLDVIGALAALAD